MDAQGMGMAFDHMIKGIIIIALVAGISIGVFGFYMAGCIKGKVAESRENNLNIEEACEKHPDLKLCEEANNG